MAWTKDDFDAAYRGRPLVQVAANTWRAIGPPGFTLAYHRAAHMPRQRADVINWVTDLGILATDSIVIGGCGYNWAGEIIDEHFGTDVNVIGVDVSAYIQGSKDQTEETEIRSACTAQGITGAAQDAIVAELVDGQKSRKPVLNEKLDKPNSIRAVKNMLAKDGADWVITEEMLQTMTDAEIASYGPHLDDLVLPGGHVVHITATTAGSVSPDQPTLSTPLRWLSGAEWRTVLNNAGLSHHMLYVLETREVL